MKKITERQKLEPQLAASMLYYDKHEFNSFLKLWRSIENEPELEPSGNFRKFIGYLEEYNNIAETELTKGAILKYVTQRVDLEPSKLKKNQLLMWMDAVIAEDSPSIFEIGEDLFYHYVWLCYKDSIELIEKQEVPYKEKLLLEPVRVDYTESEGIFSKISQTKTEEIEAFETGMPFLDDYLKPSKTNFMVIAARPGVGKTTFMLQMALHNASKGIQTLFISLEMTDQQIETKILNWYKGYNVDPEDYAKVKMEPKFQYLDKHLDLILNKTNNAETILKLAKDAVRKFGTEIIFLDYLQIARYNDVDEWASLRKLTFNLKKFGTENKVLVVSCSQVDRKSDDYGMTLGSLFGSSSIEADTDIVIGIEAMDSGSLLTEIKKGSIKILKNRMGLSNVKIDTTIHYNTLMFEAK